jgi:hypothetical protein
VPTLGARAFPCQHRLALAFPSLILSSLPRTEHSNLAVTMAQDLISLLFIKPARMASQASNTGCYFLLLLLSHWASNSSGRPQFGGPTPRTPFFMTGGHRPISHRTTSAIQTAHTWRMSSVTSFPTMTQLVKLYSIVKGNLSASNVGVSRDVSVRRTCVNSRYSTSNSSAKASTRPRFGGRRRTRHSA